MSFALKDHCYELLCFKAEMKLFGSDKLSLVVIDAIMESTVRGLSESEKQLYSALNSLVLAYSSIFVYFHLLSASWQIKLSIFQRVGSDRSIM